MKTKQNRSSFDCRAFNLLELLVVILLALIMVGLFFPVPTHSKAKAVRIMCASNLKQVGLAFRLWEGDHGDHFPMQFYTNESGAPQFADATNAFRYFQVMSNELNNPKVVVCPADDRIAATNFSLDFSSIHISYFIGLDADETRPQAFLAGDSNITNGMKLKDGIMEMTTNQFVEWTKDRHQFAGNIGLADGSVQQFSSSALRTALQRTGFATNRLLFP